MKMTFSPVAGLLVLLLSPGLQAAPEQAAPAPRILVTLQVLEVPRSAAPIIGPEPSLAPGTYDALLKSEGGEATEVSVQTANDFPGIARYSRVIAFTAQDGGKPVRGFVTIPTSLEARPHVNADGTITVHLKIEVTQTVPTAAGAVPMTTSQSVTTVRTFRNGGTLLFGGNSLVTSGKQALPPETKEMLQFVTVMVLPSEGAAR